jgi:hypothetical protein
MKCSPYHTIIPETGGERNVYHNYTDCPAGSRIKPEHKQVGTDNRPRCKDCVAKD